MDVTERDVTLPDGRRLHVYDTGPSAGPVVHWHHGTPNIGTPPAPLFAAAERLGVRWISHDRPGYGPSSPHAGRDVASAAGDAAAVADALGVERFAVMGHSGGAPHALACAALLTGRVTRAVCGAGLAPFGADGLDWFAGMTPSGAASLRAARRGRAAKEAHEASAAYDPEMFTPSDHAALVGEWSWFDAVVGPAVASNEGGPIDDDLAYVAPWGFAPAQVAAPVVVLHGADDRVVPHAHGAWLAAHLPDAELRTVPSAGHIAVLAEAPAALEWLAGC